MCSAIRLRRSVAKRTNSWATNIRWKAWEDRHAACEADFKAYHSKRRCAGIGACRRVVVAGGRGIRGDRRTSGRRSIAGQSTDAGSRAHLERRRDRRCQPRHILCLRQGDRRDSVLRTEIRAARLPRLRRLPRLQGLRPGLPRLCGLRRLRRLWRLRLRLLLAVGRLPRLLDLSGFLSPDRSGSSWPGLSRPCLDQSCSCHEIAGRARADRFRGKEAGQCAAFLRPDLAETRSHARQPGLRILR